MTDGTIKKLKTGSTPAMVTELVTTMPKDRKKTKSQSETESLSCPNGSVSLEAARRGRRTNQCNKAMAAYSAAIFATSEAPTVNRLPTRIFLTCSAPCGERSTTNTVAAVATT